MITAKITPSQFGGLPMVDLAIYKDDEIIVAVNCISRNEAVQTAVNEKAEIVGDIEEIPDNEINQTIISLFLKLSAEQRQKVLNFAKKLKDK